MTDKCSDTTVEIQKDDAEEAEDLPGDNHREAYVEEEAFEQLLRWVGGKGGVGKYIEHEFKHWLHRNKQTRRSFRDSLTHHQ